jgi:hypothetical protein
MTLLQPLRFDSLIGLRIVSHRLERSQLIPTVPSK